MSLRTTMAAAVLAMLSTPSVATAVSLQSTAMQPAMSQHQDGRPMAEQNGSAAREANRASMDHVRMRRYRQDVRAQYRMDQRAYVRAMMERNHERAVNRYDRRVMRQQNAYAAAMASWRRQVAACHHGNHRACRAPTPRVADFY